IGLLVDDPARQVALDDMHADRLLEEQPKMEERHRKGARSIGEQRKVVAIADFSPLLVIDLLQHVRRGAWRRDVGPMRPGASLRLEQIISERDWRIVLQAVGLSGESLAKGTERRHGRGRAFEQRATI